MKSTILSYDHCSAIGQAEAWYDSAQDRTVSGYCVAKNDAETGEGDYLAEGSTLDEAREVFRADLVRTGYNPTDYGL